MLYFISSACPALCDAIPLAIHDEEGNLEDVKKTEQVANDVLDGWRYGLKSMLSPGGKPRAVEISERLAKCATPQQMAMMHRFLEAKWKHRGKGFRLHR